MFKKYLKNKKGFTIIETMISIAIFLMIVMVGMGALLNANSIHNKSQDQRSIMDSLNFIMEDMSRNIRTGYDYYCIDNGDIDSASSGTKSCLSGSAQGGISFNSSIDGSRWSYYFDSDHNLNLQKITEENSNTVQLNSNEITFSNTSGFIVAGADPDDNQQPFVIIRLVGEITSKGNTTPFSLQTSVSQRLIDMPVLPIAPVVPVVPID